MARQVFRDSDIDRRFARTGYVALPFLSEDECRYLAAVWQDLNAPVHSFGFSASVMSEDAAYRARVSEEIGAVFTSKLQALLCDYRFCFGNFVTKRAGTSEGIPIHQDATFVDESRFESVNFWVTLNGVNRENGCLRLMPGSQTLNLAPRGTNRRFPYPQFETLIGERYLVDMPIPRGWACVMNQRTFHTSYPNNTGTHRICASALAVPAESTLLYLFQRPDEGSDRIDVFDVDDAFYRFRIYGAPVSDASPIATWPVYADPIDDARLQAAFRASCA